MQERRFVQRCRECGQVRDTGFWRHVSRHDADWLLVDAYCPSCFAGFLGSVIRVRASAKRTGAGLAAAGETIYGGPQVV